MIVKRIPLNEEPISGKDRVNRYDEYSGKFIMPEYRYFVRKIVGYGIKNGRVLDIGTGNGKLAIELAKKNKTNFQVTGLDISQDMLLKASENSEASNTRNVSWVQATAARLPFSDNFFDLVMSYASLHHWQDPVSVLNEIWRVTRPGGAIIIRDNRRVYGSRFWEACIWMLSQVMTKEQRKLWPKSILASYTVPEVKEIFKQSDMKGYKIGTDFVKFDISIVILHKL